ncbi:MAG: ParB N-terminal domain-containing protein [Nitrospirota bacterium]
MARAPNPTEGGTRMNRTIVWLSPDELVPNPISTELFTTTEEEYQVVRDAIISAGVILCPLLVGPQQDGRYMIHSGLQRYRAAKELGYARVPCLVVETPHERIVAMYDNVFRRQITMELARQYRERAAKELSERDLSVKDDIAIMRDRFINALAAHPDADREQVLRTLFEELQARYPGLSSNLITRITPELSGDSVSATTAHTERAAHSMTLEVNALKSRLAESNTVIAARQADLESASRRISELEAELQSARGAQPVAEGSGTEDPSKMTPHAKREHKRIQAELEEAHRSRVEFSKKLKNAKEELETATAALADKTKRVEALESQVSVLRNAESYWKQNWEHVCNLVLDAAAVSRDIVLVVETLQHVHDVLVVCSEWPESLHDVVKKGLDQITAMTEQLRAVATAAAIKSSPDNAAASGSAARGKRNAKSSD